MKMKKKLIFILLFPLLFVSCIKNEMPNAEAIWEEQIKQNVETVFGVQFNKNQDWCTTVNGTVNVHLNDAEKDIVKVQILMPTINVNDSTISIKSLNEAVVNGRNEITFVYDAPNICEYLFVAFIDNNGFYYYKKFELSKNSDVYLNSEPVKARALTRSLSQNYVLPTNPLVINGTVVSFANQRGWIPDEVFYTYDYGTMNSDDYDAEFKTIFRNIIFNYFPNGRKYNNLPKIKKSGYYNESAYPITTGDEPIIISPVYKNDGGYHEISEAELYYYYYKGNNMTKEDIEALPKYKAVTLSDIYTNNNNDNIAKTKSYALVYWEDGIPSEGTTGSYYFPKGYKIGFMYKSNTTTDNKKKQGELYCDGRLNGKINSWGNFASSHLESTAPRMAWMSVNDKMFLCVESGTDADFNDLIIEVEGGIEPINIIPDEPEHNFYTFCYEDQRLGDYDMNDVVLKGYRKNETCVEWTLMATGAMDELYIYNIEGEKINHNTEVHEIFGKAKGTFINTIITDNTPYVKDEVTVSKDFSFLDVTKQPYIYDKTKNWEVKIARQGEDPHAIMIPYDFKWPLEKICIKNAYKRFNNWGVQMIDDTDWYKYPEEGFVYIR